MKPKQKSQSADIPSMGTQIKLGALFLGLVIVIAVAGSLATIPNTKGWYLDVEKVAWNPPNAVFGPAWSLLYLLIALSGFLLWRAGYSGPVRENTAKSALVPYFLQLGLNAIWTPIFFAGYPLAGKAAWWLGLVVILTLIAVVIWLIPVAARFSKTAAWLMLPYLLWLVFAASLNAGIIVLN